MEWKYYNQEAILDLNRIYRINLINSITGFKPANLISSRSADGQSNLAIFSSVVHLGSDPALIGFIMRPNSVERHTYDNIAVSGVYTINHVPDTHTAMAHYTSAKFDRAVSEFDTCDFTETFLGEFPAPYVAESPIKIGMKLVQEIPIEINRTTLMIGAVEHLYIAEHLIESDGALNLDTAGTACISGLSTYYATNRLAKYPYARVGQPSKNTD